MDSEASYNPEDEERFWNELNDILKFQCDSHAEIDNALRSYLELATKCKDVFLHNEQRDVFFRCTGRLLSSDLFATNADYIRHQIIFSLLQEDSADTLYAILSLLLFDGRRNEGTFEIMNGEGTFVRLLELIQSSKDDGGHGGAGIHRLLIDLLYEMSRIQRIKIEDLVIVDDDFIKHLFEIIEDFSDDVNDPYHYPIIRVLLVLNEQFMVSAHDPGAQPSFIPPTNKVIKILSIYGDVYKTFGENIILLLNRESETSLQLLTLKLLYLLFTTPSTYEYFYTNDLRVLVDILIRNLLDLPEEAAALRHTYLRVLYPLLTHTQLRYPPHHKREELRKLLGILIRGQWSDVEEVDYEKILHFDEVDETTKRLVLRCGQVDWLVDRNGQPAQKPPTPVETNEASKGQIEASSGTNLEVSESTPTSPDTNTDGDFDNKPDISSRASPIPHHKMQSIGMELEPARSSSLSVEEVASHKEKPGVIMPIRNIGSLNAAASALKQKPEPPKARRSRARRRPVEEEGGGERNTTHPLASPDTRPTRGSSVPESPTFNSTERDMKTPPTQPSPCRTTNGLAGPNAKKPTTKGAHLLTPHHPQHPPAVPPPRKSSHSVPPPQHSQHHHHPRPPSHSLSGAAVNGQQVQKPEPPKTRRWRAHQQQQQQSQTRSGESDKMEGDGVSLQSTDNTGNSIVVTPPTQ